MVDLDKLKSKAAQADKSEASEKQPEVITAVQEINESEAEVVAESRISADVKSEPKLFQHYTCARSSMKMITKTGIPIIFVAHKHITNNQKIISYLDSEIRLGLKVVTKGEAMTEEDADPMSRLRREIIAEYLAKEAIENAESGEPIKSGTGILSSADIVTAGASSSSDAGASPSS